MNYKEKRKTLTPLPDNSKPEDLSENQWSTLFGIIFLPALTIAVFFGIGAKPLNGLETMAFLLPCIAAVVAGAGILIRTDDADRSEYLEEVPTTDTVISEDEANTHRGDGTQPTTPKNNDFIRNTASALTKRKQAKAFSQNLFITSGAILYFSVIIHLVSGPCARPAGLGYLAVTSIFIFGMFTYNKTKHPKSIKNTLEIAACIAIPAAAAIAFLWILYLGNWSTDCVEINAPIRYRQSQI